MKPKTRKLLTTAALSTGVVWLPACIPLPGIAGPLEHPDAGLSRQVAADAAADAASDHMPPDHGPTDAGAAEAGPDGTGDGAQEGGE